jgi:endonuclease YncB( thermonuclease family)
MPSVRIEGLVGRAQLTQSEGYGRVLRYIDRGGVNVYVEMVRQGAAAPSTGGDRGPFADQLYSPAVSAKTAHRGLWGACPATQLPPDEAVTAVRSARSSGGRASGGNCEPTTRRA